MITVEYTSHCNDLFAEFECKCPSSRFKGSAIARHMKEKIKLTGYNDSYFFDVVNKELRSLKCKCGRKYAYQWKREGVEIKQLKEETP